MTEKPSLLSKSAGWSRQQYYEGKRTWSEFGYKVWRRILWWNTIALVSMHIIREYIIPEAKLEGLVTSSGAWEVFFSVFGIVYAIIISMLIVEALGRFNNLSSVIEQELNAVEDIRDFLIYLQDDDEARPIILSRLSSYIASVVKCEWPEMRKQPKKKKGEEMDSDTSKELKCLMEAVREIRSNEGAGKVAHEAIINKVAEVTTYRTERIRKSGEYITYPLRILIMGLSVVIAGGLILMFVEPYWVNLLMVICSITAMATLYTLILDLNHPFSEGELWEISPLSFEKVRDNLSNSLNQLN